MNVWKLCDVAQKGEKRMYIITATYQGKRIIRRAYSDLQVFTIVNQKQMEVSELDGLAKASGISTNALKNAKTALKKDKEIHTWSVGFNPKKYLIALTASEKPNEYD